MIKKRETPKKVSLTVMISEENANLLRKLVYKAKSEGEEITISSVIDTALKKVFNDAEMRTYASR